MDVQLNNMFHKQKMHSGVTLEPLPIIPGPLVSAYWMHFKNSYNSEQNIMHVPMSIYLL